MKRIFTALVTLSILTTIPTLPAHAALPEPHWVLGTNDWGIAGEAVPPPSEMLDADKIKLRSELKNTELYSIEPLMQRSKRGGGCWGSCVTSILSAYGLINYSLYPHENGTVPRGLTDIGFPYLSDKGKLEDAKCPPAAGSLLQYYHCLQCADVFRQHTAWFRYATTQKERTDMLLNKLENGKPVLVETWVGSVQEGQTGHAVVAYDVETSDDGRFDRGNRHYDKRIMIYDPNLPRKLEYPTDFDSERLDWIDSIYLNSETGDWCLQWLGGSYAGGEIGDIIDDVNLLNMHGLLEGTEQYHSEKPFLGVMTSNWIGQDHRLQKITLHDGVAEVSGDAAYLETPAFYMDYNANAILNYLTEDVGTGYRMVLDQPQELETVMYYENSIGKAWSDQAQETDVMPDGYVAFKGELASYGLEYCLNEGYYTGAWYQVTVQGNAAEAALQMTDNGWLLQADSLYHVRIRTRSHTGGDHNMLFSADVPAVLFSENDAKEVTASVDLDGDGLFETALTDLSDKLGDLNGDGVENSSDAALILISAAKSGAGESTDLSELQTLIADVNSDGAINASDAALVLIYAAKVGAEDYSDTLLQFVLQEVHHENT